jgi:dethiobiotin synthetase
MAEWRPELLVVVAGTATEVGKTWASVRLVEELRARAVTVAVRKPAQSFDDGDTGTDAELLAAASAADPLTVCPAHRWYPVAMAPPMAADALGREPVRVADLVHETASSWHDPLLPSGVAEVGLVELAGGTWSPIAHDGDGIAFSAAVAPDVVVLVADAGLGTLNAVRPAVAALAVVAPVLVLLNRYDRSAELHRRNLAWLREHDGIDATTTVGELAARLLDRG